MKRTGRTFIAAVAAMLSTAVGLVATPSAAHAEVTCTYYPYKCGKVINNSGRTIQIRWYIDNVGWHQESLATGHFQGGYDGDPNTNDIDVDQVQVPSGCVANVSVSNSNLKVFPMGWDKLKSDQTVTVNGFSCGDGRVYAWNEPWNDSLDPPTKACSWFDDDLDWGNDCGVYGFRNLAGSVQNNSSQGNSVNFYFHGGFTGAWGCLGPGSVWRDLRANRFNLGLGLDGYNKAMYHEIASSKWVRACG
ncbi:hypothetical protein FHX75_111270 [Micromonospora palomenae]|uniref:Peptidase inhibitor family I36 n=1 Tax=Micromonospora palomenae TaxID=1461247 RepID=A0A561WWA3_9ACTN|nr:hypothetical protein [Micromonospora palomenae]TWG28119.1 hypothetical protein FHX75_111270 [Micromonospora palomenae]